MRSKPRTSTPPTARSHIFTVIATALTGAVLATSVLITADAASVFDGESLPQVLLILLTGIVASFSTISFWPRGQGWRARGWLLSTLVVWLLLSALSATWLANGRAAWNGFWHVVGLLTFALIVRELGRQPAVARAFTELLFMGAVSLSVHAVHQVTISLPETRAAYLRDPDQALAEVNIDAPPGSAMRAQYENRLLHSSEPLATFALTNSLAVALSGVLVALSVWIAYQVRSPSSHRIAIVAAGLAWVLIGTAWVLTKSRMAYLSVFMVAVGAIIFWWRKRRATATDYKPRLLQIKWIGAAAVASVSIFAAVVFLLARDNLILSEAPKSLTYRLEYWQASSMMILDHPLTGVGLGNFQSYYPRYKLATASEIVADPHNWCFDIAATSSLPVLGLVLISLMMVVSRSWANLRERLCSVPQNEARSAVLHSSDAAVENQLVKALWIGAAVGWTLTVVLQWLVQEAIDLEASLLGLVAAVIVAFCMRSGSQPTDAVWRSAALAALMTMIINLLAAGSWQASGLALPMAVWVGVCLPATLVQPQHIIPGRVNGKESGVRAMRGIMIVLLFGFLWQTWRPVNLSWTQQQGALAALAGGDHLAAHDKAVASIEADPLDPAPRRLLVQVLASDVDRQSPEQFELAAERVESAIESLLACDPAAARNWSFAAETLVTLAARAEERQLAPQSQRLLGHADKYFVGAIERYPSNVALHAQRAVLLALLSQSTESRAELEEAYSLSEATPHLDRKLNMQQIWLPPALAKFPEAVIQRPSTSSSWVQAEPLCDLLRTK